MAIGLTVVSPKTKLVATGGALVGGLANGYIMSKNPTAGFVTTLMTAIGTTVGAMFTKGALSEVLGGAGMGAIGAFALLIPLMAVGTRRIGGPVQKTYSAAEEAAGIVGRTLGIGSVWPAPRAEEEFKGVRLV